MLFFCQRVHCYHLFPPHPTSLKIWSDFCNDRWLNTQSNSFQPPHTQEEYENLNWSFMALAKIWEKVMVCYWCFKSRGKFIWITWCIRRTRISAFIWKWPSLIHSFLAFCCVLHTEHLVTRQNGSFKGLRDSAFAKWGDMISKTAQLKMLHQRSDAHSSDLHSYHIGVIQNSVFGLLFLLSVFF